LGRKVHLEVRSSEPNELVIDPRSDGILVGIIEWDDQLIVAVKLDENGEDIQVIIHDGVFEGAVMAHTEGQVNLPRTRVGRGNGERYRSPVKSSLFGASQFQAHVLLDVLEDVYLRERFDAWLQDRLDALRQGNEAHESLFLPTKDFGCLSLERMYSLRDCGNFRRKTLNESVY
jgi:hypothetical protein